MGELIPQTLAAAATEVILYDLSLFLTHTGPLSSFAVLYCCSEVADRHTDVASAAHEYSDCKPLQLLFSQQPRKTPLEPPPHSLPLIIYWVSTSDLPPHNERWLTSCTRRAKERGHLMNARRPNTVIRIWSFCTHSKINSLAGFVSKVKWMHKLSIFWHHQILHLLLIICRAKSNFSYRYRLDWGCKV